MIDLAALGSLLMEIFGASKEWREPKIVRFSLLEEANKEQVVRDLWARGDELQWVHVYEERLRELKRKGWVPVVERDRVGRPTVFMDRKSELILVHRSKPPAEPSD
jgi:hypothetical protein